MADSIVVQIDKESALPDGGVTTTVDANAPDPIADLKAQHERLEAEAKRERDGREAATRQAQNEQAARIAAEQERDAARSEATDTRTSAIEQGVAAAQAASDAAKSKITTAMEAGDWKAVADAQVELADARADFKRFSEAKADVELQRLEQPRRQTEQQQRPQPPVDPLQAFLASRSPATQAWLQNHPDELRALAYNDPRRGKKINAAHEDAQAEGLTIDSPEYFAHIEQFIGLKPNGAANGTHNGAQQQQPRRNGSAPVAPVQASAGGTNGGGEVVRLSAGEARAATDGTHIWNYDDPSPQKRFKKGDPIGTQEFARRKLAMQKSGEYDKSN